MTVIKIFRNFVIDIGIFAGIFFSMLALTQYLGVIKSPIGLSHFVLLFVFLVASHISDVISKRLGVMPYWGKKHNDDNDDIHESGYSEKDNNPNYMNNTKGDQ